MPGLAETCQFRMVVWWRSSLPSTTPPNTCKGSGGQSLKTKSCIVSLGTTFSNLHLWASPQGSKLFHPALYTGHWWTVGGWDWVLHSLHPSGYWISILGSWSTHQESTKANHFASPQQADFSNHQEFITALVCLHSLGTDSACELFGDTPFPINQV